MPICESCGKEGAGKRCARCQESRYCSIACQTAHWKAGHKHKCVKVATPGAGGAPAPSALPAAAATAQSSSSSDGGGGGGGGGAPESFALPAAATAQGDSGGGASAEEAEKCAICIDALQQPQTMPCGHRFCRECVASMRQHGVAEVQVCPLCRGPLPDAERLAMQALVLVVRLFRWDYHRWEERGNGGVPLPAWVQELLCKTAVLSRAALAIDPAQVHAHFSLGVVLGQKGRLPGRDLRGAAAAYRASLAADPCYAQAHFNLGNVLVKLGEPIAAEAAFRAAAIAVEAKHGGESDAARSRRLRTCHADAHFNVGIMVEARQDVAGAEAAYRTAVAANPQHAGAQSNLACILEERGDVAGALAAYRAAAGANPQLVEAHFNLGLLLCQCGDTAGAEAAFRAAIAADPQCVPAHENLGDVLAHSGDAAGAARARRAAAKIIRRNE